MTGEGLTNNWSSVEKSSLSFGKIDHDRWEGSLANFVTWKSIGTVLFLILKLKVKMLRKIGANDAKIGFGKRFTETNAPTTVKGASRVWVPLFPG